MLKIEAQINSPLDKVWDYYNSAKHIAKWNFASDDWCCPTASIDFTEGGEFCNRMEAKDGSIGFDFKGKYLQITPSEKVEYEIEDGRKVYINFVKEGEKTVLKIDFEAENQHDEDFQLAGWQAILNNFKKYTEAN